jgi:hypothetical protein
MKSIILFCKINIPGNIELLLNHAKYNHNFLLYDFHSILYYTRNLFYFFTFISIFFYYFHYYYISYYFVSFGFINHVYSFYKWNKCMTK